MAYGAQVTAIVEYWCVLSDEDSERVDNYISDRTAEDPMFPPTLEEAIAKLYDRGEINLYDNSSESDFWTKSVDSAGILS